MLLLIIQECIIQVLCLTAICRILATSFKILPTYYLSNNILKRHGHHRNSSLSFALQVSRIMQTAVPDHSSHSKWAGLQTRNNGAVSANVLVVGGYYYSSNHYLLVHHYDLCPNTGAVSCATLLTVFI